MSQKRHSDDGNPRFPEEKRRRFNFGSVVDDVIKIRSVEHLLEPVLEPLIRRVVKEEIEVAMEKHLANLKWNRPKQIEVSHSRSLRLQFANGLSLPVFTGARIEGEDSPTIKVELIDSTSGKVVDSGPESSAKVEIVVLEGDFDGDEGDSWSLEEFKSNIVKQREGKKPLLTGDVVFSLKEGIGMVGEVSFTDNSSWTRSRKFRLGATVLDNSDGIRIQEAVTESFIVRDHRGELYKKHYPPLLFDEVWRLEKIGKDGAFHKRLIRENVNTVKDFLTLLILDPSRLRQILGTGMSAKMWEATAEHARTCVLDKRVNLYYPPALEQKTGVVFNIVGQVTGLLTESQYVSVEKLSETEKVDAQSWVIAAFENRNEVVSFDDEASLLESFSHLSNITHTPSLPGIEHCNASNHLASLKIGELDYTHPTTSTPVIVSSMCSVGAVRSLDDYNLQNIENMALRYDRTLSLPGQESNHLISETDSDTYALSIEEHLRLLDEELQSHNLHLEAEGDLQAAIDAFLLTHPSTVVASSAAVAIDKAQRRWKKISSVLKWFSVRKLVASKRTSAREIH